MCACMPYVLYCSTTHQMKSLAFIRTDRLQTNKLLEEAVKDGQELSEGWHACSVAALMADDMGRRKFLYIGAARRGLMIQTKEDDLQLMKRKGGSRSADGA